MSAIAWQRYGLAQLRSRPSWVADDLAITLETDRHGIDAFAGGRFTLEFEAFESGRLSPKRLGHKLSGRAKLHQLLGLGSLERFCDVQNQIIARLSPPPPEWTASLPDGLAPFYLKRFEAESLEPGRSCRWLRYATDEDLPLWSGLIEESLGELLENARALSPTVVYPESAWLG